MSRLEHWLYNAGMIVLLIAIFFEVGLKYPGMKWLRDRMSRFIPWIGLAVTVIVLTVIVANLAGQVKTLKSEVNLQQSCVHVLKEGGGVVRAVCDPAIATLYDVKVAGERCDRAIVLGGISSDCTPAVAQLYGNELGIRQQLDTTLQDQSAAISRAESRVRQETLRKSKDAQSLASAPRGADGLIVCDAQCLRDRFEDAGAH